VDAHPHAAHQAAIAEARSRYERGLISYDAFRRAMDALALADDEGDCQAVLDALPHLPLTKFDDPQPPAPRLSPAAPTTGGPNTPNAHIVAFMSQVKKTRRPWQLAPDAEVTAFMGEVKLDLNLAQMQPYTRLRVRAIMGTVVLYVPRGVRVSVRSSVIMGDANLLGESINGVINSGHEEHIPPEAPTAELEIDAFVLMSNVRVAIADAPVISLGELMRDTMRAVAEGVRRGLQEPSQPGHQGTRTPEIADH
jgi:hypothetical protein